MFYHYRRTYSLGNSNRSRNPFKIVHIDYGIQDLSSIIDNGTFTCERRGYYLIAVAISSRGNSNGGYFDIVKNHKVIAAGHKDPENFVITSTAIVMEHLDLNDTVYVKSGTDQKIDSENRSTLTIVQIN